MSAIKRETGPGDLAGRPRDKRVGELLIEEGLISTEQLGQALEEQAKKGGKLFEILINQKTLTKESLHSFLSKQSGVPSIDLRNYEIPRELVSIIPDDFAREHVVLPIDKLGKLLTVGMACPLDVVAIQDLEHITGLKVKAMLCKLDDIQARIRRYYPVKEAAPPPPPAPKPPAPQAPPPRQAGPRRTPPRRDAVDLIERSPYLPLLNGSKPLVAIIKDPGHTIRDLAILAAGEPALCGRMLSVANSSAYGMPGNVMNIYLAATLLGCAGVSAIADEMKEAQVPDECPAFVAKRFLLRSVFCATAAMAGAQKSSRVHPTDAYTAGLMHDCGRLALAYRLPVDYARVDCGLSIFDLMDSELGEFGFTHAEAGYRLAKAWGLPDAIAGAIRTHHDVEALKLDPLSATVALMALMAEAFERSAPIKPEGLLKSRGLLAQSGLDAAAAVEIYDNTSMLVKSPPLSKILKIG